MLNFYILRMYALFDSSIKNIYNTLMKQLTELLRHYQPKPLGVTKQYAVFIPLILDREGAWHILYQVRSETISQPGEIAFPGGRLEEGETPRKGVLRETMEELNLPEQSLKILGEIDYFVYQDMMVYCFVGQLVLEDWTQITPNEEVQRLFTVPLADLLEKPPIYYELTAELTHYNDFPFDRIRHGKNYDFSHQNRLIPFYEHLGENIWGMTAQLTHRLTQLLTEK